MGLGNMLILTQVTLLMLALVFSLFLLIPLATNRSDMKGHCLLHAHGVWYDTPLVPLLNITKWGPSSNCNFPLFMGAVTLPLSFCYMCWMAFFLFKGTTPSWLSAFCTMIVTSIVTLFLFISCILLSSGTRSLCNLIREKYSCFSAEVVHFLGRGGEGLNTRHFYVQFGVAQFGAWLSLVCWMLMLICCFVQLLQYHRDEDFTTSARRERDRLLARYQPDHDVSL